MLDRGLSFSLFIIIFFSFPFAKLSLFLSLCVQSLDVARGIYFPIFFFFFLSSTGISAALVRNITSDKNNSSDIEKNYIETYAVGPDAKEEDERKRFVRPPRKII